MRLVFAGTPDFAAVALHALHRAGHEIVLVLTQPDRRSGRGLHAIAPAVKRVALQFGFPISQPLSLKEPQIERELTALAPHAMVVAAYGLIVPPVVLAVPEHGCINIHASLLPRWRGAAPIQRAILAGDTHTGVSIMQMDAGLDTGPVLREEKIEIAANDTAQTLHDKLAQLGARLIVQALEAPLNAHPQDETRATYAAKLDKREAVIDWREPAVLIERSIRAFDPAPGAQASHRGITLKIWKAAVERSAGEPPPPGQVLRVNSDGLVVACGQGTTIRLTELQRAGGKRLPAAAFLAGYAISAGDTLGAGN
jgi:methionyl-tRNA formyltransferase